MGIRKDHVYIAIYLPKDILKDITKELDYVNDYEKGKLYTINVLLADILTKWSKNPIIFKSEDIKMIKGEKKRIGISLQSETFNKFMKLYVNNYVGEISSRNDLIIYILTEHLKCRAA